MRVAIAGAAECDLGLTGLGVQQLQAQAVTRALADAGLALSEVDGLATTGHGRFPATQLADYLGLQPTWCDSTAAGGAVFEMYVARAVQALQAGQCRTAVIVFASNQRSARSRSMAGEPNRFEDPFQPLWPLSYYAMVAQRYLHTYGLGRADLARQAVWARQRAQLNPAAFTHGQGELSVEEVLAAPMVSSPLGKLDCCLVTDGGGAIVLTTLDRARELRRRPVVVTGYGEVLTHAEMTSAADLLAPGAQAAGAQAFTRSGLSPADIDVVQVYDSFTISVPLALEQLGFCGPGEGTAWRERPFNTGGGGLAYCHPGQLGVLLLVEAVRQLRGECGARQVPGARTALVHGTGGIMSSHATVILEAG